jgi:molybdate transport system ATP-binding protein
VALARALAGDPQLLLLDEPLAALDARTRAEVRGALRRYLTTFAGPSVLVTHDPVEAMVLADRLLVLEGGRVVQQGRPADVARRPVTPYVAQLVGLNLYPGRLVDPGRGRVEIDSGGVLFAAGTDPDAEVGGEPATTTRGLPPGHPVLVRVAPSAIAVFDHPPDASSVRNVWSGRVTSVELLADRVRLAVSGRPPALVDITPAALADLHLDVGQQVWLAAKATEVAAYVEGPGSGVPGWAPETR